MRPSAFFGPAGRTSAKHPQSLALGRNDKLDKVCRQFGMGCAFQYRDGVGVDCRSPSIAGHHESDERGSHPEHFLAAEKVDHNCRDRLRGAYIVRRRGADVADHARVGEHQGHQLPPFFPTVLLKDHFITGTHRPGLGRVGQREVSEPRWSGKISPPARRDQPQFADPILVDHDAEIRHCRGDPAVVGAVERGAEDVGGDLAEDAVGELGLLEEAAFVVVDEGCGSAAEGDVITAGGSDGVLGGECANDVLRAIASDIGPGNFDRGAVFFLMPVAEGGFKFAADIAAVRGDHDQRRHRIAGISAPCDERDDDREQHAHHHHSNKHGHL